MSRRNLSAGPTKIGSMRLAWAASRAPRNEVSSQGYTTIVFGDSTSAARANNCPYFGFGLLSSMTSELMSLPASLGPQRVIERLQEIRASVQALESLRAWAPFVGEPDVLRYFAHSPSRMAQLIMEVRYSGSLIDIKDSFGH